LIFKMSNYLVTMSDNPFTSESQSTITRKMSSDIQ
jgi:hypothetical protein